MPRARSRSRQADETSARRPKRFCIDELPIIPIYYRVSTNMVRPYVKGFYPTLLDVHPLDPIWIDEAEKKKFLEAGRSRVIWFLCRRLLWMIGTLWVVFTVTFFLMHAVPGGPFSSERKPPTASSRRSTQRYNLDLPVWQQYLIELNRLSARRFRPELQDGRFFRERSDRRRACRFRRRWAFWRWRLH